MWNWCFVQIKVVLFTVFAKNTVIVLQKLLSKSFCWHGKIVAVCRWIFFCMYEEVLSEKAR